MAKEKIVGARVTAEELRRIEVAAGAEGRSVSDYLRSIVPAATGSVAPGSRRNPTSGRRDDAPTGDRY